MLITLLQTRDMNILCYLWPCNSVLAEYYLQTDGQTYMILREFIFILLVLLIYKNYLENYMLISKFVLS